MDMPHFNPKSRNQNPMIKTAVITAGGKGTRLQPITRVIPKVLLPLGTKPTIHYVVDEALDAGIKKIVLIIGQNGYLIRDYFNGLGKQSYKKIKYVEQSQPRGL